MTRSIRRNTRTRARVRGTNTARIIAVALLPHPPHLLRIPARSPLLLTRLWTAMNSRRSVRKWRGRGRRRKGGVRKRERGQSKMIMRTGTRMCLKSQRVFLASWNMEALPPRPILLQNSVLAVVSILMIQTNCIHLVIWMSREMLFHFDSPTHLFI